MNEGMHLQRTLPVLVRVSGLAQMQALAMREGLTRAFTRRHMRQLLDEEAARQRRTRRIFCVAMLDIAGSIAGSIASDTLGQVVERADKALYQAKSAGRKQTCIGASQPSSEPVAHSACAGLAAQRTFLITFRPCLL